jgi:putative ABC transport system ATP-binding protein
MSDKSIVRTEKLNVVYFPGKPNQVNAVTDANLEIYPGEFIIFFGPSGCGKSTLLYAIAGLERNIRGNIFIADKNLAKFKSKDLDYHSQHTIGMIFQAYYLISSLSVLNNIILPQFSLKTKNKDREKKALELLQFFGVDKQRDKYPNELSGGQQQRVAICRSLINDPELILADEPTGNLDSKSATDVMNLLLELNEKKGKTVILVTHSPGSLDYAHRVFHMKDGRIINTTINREKNQPIAKTILKANPLAKDLETTGESHQTATGTISSKSEVLADLKAKEIVMETLTGLSSDEIDRIETIVEKMLLGSVKSNSKELLNCLDNDIYRKGVGLDSRTANNLTTKIKQLIKEIKDLHRAEEKTKNKISHDPDRQIASIRRYIFKQFKIRPAASQAVVNFDNLIKDRLAGLIDQLEVGKNLNLPVADGGVGLDKRLVDKISKHIELLILGKL